MSLSTPGATEIADAPLASLTPEQAGARRAELMATPEFTKAAIEGNVGKQEMLRDLWMLERGHSLQSPEDAAAVAAQMTDRDRELDEARLATWERLVPMDDQQKFEHRRGLATAQQVADAKDAIERMKKDSAFRVRVLNGDQDAVRQWLLAGRVATMQVAPDDHDRSK